MLSSSKSRVLKRWKLLDNSITDANNEAKDNVKYLSTLEKYIEPLRVGNPETILDSLPGLLNNIKMMVRPPPAATAHETHQTPETRDQTPPVLPPVLPSRRTLVAGLW